jgi:hypothetical protein
MQFLAGSVLIFGHGEREAARAAQNSPMYGNLSHS